MHVLDWVMTIYHEVFP